MEGSGGRRTLGPGSPGKSKAARRTMPVSAEEMTLLARPQAGEEVDLGIANANSREPELLLLGSRR